MKARIPSFSRGMLRSLLSTRTSLVSRKSALHLQTWLPRSGSRGSKPFAATSSACSRLIGRSRGRSSENSCQGFGDSFVLFTNTPEFLSRVVAAAESRRLEGDCRLVRYYDETKYWGKIGRFHKRSIYSHESEYRIALEAGGQGPFRFEIGDLHDITSESSRWIPPMMSVIRREDAKAAGLSWD